jgi:hypothetical protein
MKLRFCAIPTSFQVEIESSIISNFCHQDFMDCGITFFQRNISNNQIDHPEALVVKIIVFLS